MGAGQGERLKNIDLDSSKDEILKILNESEKIPTGGILIGGDWGVGKTFFWDKEIAPNIRGEKVPRVSIAGISTADAIYKAVVTAKYIHSVENLSTKNWCSNLKLIGSMKLKRIKDWFSGKRVFFIEVLKKAGLDHSQFDLVKTLLRSIPWSELIPKNSVVCLDDVERKALPSIELLGLIIYLTEVKNCKVVLIANDVQLDKDFKDHREKMVWRSFYPRAAIEKLFVSFVEKYSSETHIDTIKSYQNEIVIPFKRGVTNLRVFARCIQDVETILSASSGSLSARYIRFYCSLKVWQAEKGELKDREAYSAVSWYTLSLRSQKDKELTPSEEDGIAFREKFWDSKEEVAESDSLYEFAKTGLLDRVMFLNELGPVNEVSKIRILANEIREQNWFFMSDVLNLEKLSEIETVLANNDHSDPNLFLIIARDAFRICNHIDKSFPETLKIVLERKLEGLASKGIFLEELGGIDFRNEEEQDFLRAYTEKYRSVLHNFIREDIKHAILQKLNQGVEFNSYKDIKNEYQWSKAIGEALTSSEVLDLLRKIEAIHPDVYYSYFFRAIKKIKEIPDAEKDMYMNKLQNVVEAMSEVDNSSKKRKGYLVKLFNKNQ